MDAPSVTPPPDAGAGPVLRRNILQQAQDCGAALLLFDAPAGYGKTTAMSQLRDACTARGLAAHWLTLERADHDPRRFLAFVQQVTGVSLDQGATPQRPPVALFIDELEVVGGGPVPGLVRELVDRLPRGSLLVVGTRQAPPFGLARLRAQGLVMEFDAERLRFTEAEARELLARAGQAALPGDDLARLMARTGGWPAGLRLAAQALQRHPDPAEFIRHFSGSQQAVADYLSQAVFDRLPEDLREFLIATSVLRRLAAPVCQALLPRRDAAYLLERVAAMQLFLSPAAGSAGLWRYHPVFADYLRERLQREHPDEHRRLHLAASAWYERQGQVVSAIDHAIDGGDLPHAAGLLEPHAMAFLAEGRLRLLARWFDALPAPVLAPRPGLPAVALWTVTFTRGALEARRLHESSGFLCGEDVAERAHRDALQAVWVGLQDRPLDALDQGLRALQRLPTGQPYADNVLAISMAVLLAQRGERSRARQLLDATRRRQGDAPFVRMFVESVEAEQDLLDGLLRQATARLRIAIGATPVPAHDPTRANAWAGVLYGCALYEAGRLDEAERLLRIHLPVVQPVGLRDHLVMGTLALSRIARERGDADEAEALLAGLERLGTTRSLPRVVASARLERAQVLIHQGQAQAAAEALDASEQLGHWQLEREFRNLAHASHDPVLGRLRWAAHFGDPLRASSEVQAELDWARRHQRPLRALALALLRALALRRAGREAEALRQLQHTLADTAEQGFVRRIVDEGPEVLALAARLLATLAPGAQDPVLVDHLQQLLRGRRRPAAAAAPTAPVEPLTPKERHVLALLADGCSNQAMAVQLGVSENTVRTHLRNLFAKLEVGSRTQAVARARERGLLPSQA